MPASKRLAIPSKRMPLSRFISSSSGMDAMALYRRLATSRALTFAEEMSTMGLVALWSTSRPTVRTSKEPWQFEYYCAVMICIENMK